ncbi:MAG: hypothetical protein ACLQBB_08100 [Solirubrobacteraceae bacterium]
MGLIAALAITGVLAGGASAAGVPTWYECGKAAKEGTSYLGHYTDKACSAEVETGGKYERKEGLGKGKGFKGKGATSVLHVKTWLGDDTVSCAKSSDSGTPELPNRESKVTVSFSKCLALGTKTCTSAGAKKGEIKLSGLKGELGYVEESPVSVGLKLESEAHPGPEGELVKFSCEDLEVTVTGGVIGVVKKDVNAINKESELVYEAKEYIGEHEYDGYKYKPVVNIVGWADEQAEIAKEIEEDEKGEIAKIERPILKTLICGEYIESLLGVKCTPEAYAGLTGTITNKGEALMVKA